MRFLFDILHPAHVHVLRHPRQLLLEAGHDVVVTARDKDVTIELLEGYAIPHTVISTRATGAVGLARELSARTVRLDRIVRARGVDALVGLMGPSIAPVGKLRRKPTFVLYDTEVATRTNRWVYPMATEVITPKCYSVPVNGNHVTYDGYHELAYLHPDRFTPDRGRLQAFGLDPETPFIFVRLPSFVSSHDGNETHTPSHAWLRWFEQTESTHRIVVSSEDTLPAAFDRFRLSGPVTDVHHVLAAASLVVGESATMAAEAAVLGTPAVFVGATSRGYVDDIEQRYGLIRRFTPDRFPMAIKQADAILAEEPSTFDRAHRQLIDDHVDVSAWIVDHLCDQLNSDAQ